MSDDELLIVQRVGGHPAARSAGPPLRRVACEACGESVSDGARSVNGRTLCRACACKPYYRISILISMVVHGSYVRHEPKSHRARCAVTVLLANLARLSCTSLDRPITSPRLN
jgi:hypothetical protein